MLSSPTLEDMIKIPIEIIKAFSENILGEGIGDKVNGPAVVNTILNIPFSALNNLLKKIGSYIPFSNPIVSVIQTKPTKERLDQVIGVGNGNLSLQQEKNGNFRISSGAQKWDSHIIEKAEKNVFFPKFVFGWPRPRCHDLTPMLRFNAAHVYQADVKV